MSQLYLALTHRHSNCFLSVSTWEFVIAHFYDRIWQVDRSFCWSRACFIIARFCIIVNCDYNIILLCLICFSLFFFSSRSLLHLLTCFYPFEQYPFSAKSIFVSFFRNILLYSPLCVSVSASVSVCVCKWSESERHSRSSNQIVIEIRKSKTERMRTETAIFDCQYQ